MASDVSASIHLINEPPVGIEHIIDTRNKDACLAESFAGAHCVPLDELIAPNQRVPNISGLLWFWGTLGLEGNEHVTIIGDSWRQTYVVAALLHLSGQKKISVFKRPSTQWKDVEVELGAGVVRGMTRRAVFQAPMRTEAFLLRGELALALNETHAPTLLDGRSEDEYWGKSIQAARGGHLPGAISSPLSDWLGSNNQAARDALGNRNLVVYAHNSIDSLQFYTALSGAGLTPTLYLEGWIGWASDGALPIDAQSFPHAANRANKDTVRVGNTATVASGASDQPTGAGLVVPGAEYLVLFLLLVIVLLIIVIGVLVFNSHRRQH